MSAGAAPIEVPGVTMGQPMLHEDRAVSYLATRASGEQRWVTVFERGVELVSIRRDIARLLSLRDLSLQRVLEWGEVGGVVWLARELPRGELLTRRLKTAPLGAAAAVQVGVVMATVLDKVSRKGVRLTTVTPDAVFVDADSRGQLSLLPPRAVADEIDNPHAEVPRPISSGLPYWSPEVLDDAKRAGEPALVYSVGAVLYAALTGRPPFHANRNMDFFMKILNALPEPIAAAAPDTPPALVRVVEKCLAKEPAKRHATLAELSRELSLVAAK